MLLRNVGKRTETGLSCKQTLFNFDKPINAFLLNDMILFDSKMISFKLLRPLNKSSSIWFIVFLFDHNVLRDVKPVNVAGWNDDIWLEPKSKYSRVVKFLNVSGWMDDNWL